MHKHIWRQKFALHTFHFSEAIKWNISTQAYRNTHTHTTTPPICRQFALLVATHSRRLYTVGRSPPNTKLTRLACCVLVDQYLCICASIARGIFARSLPRPILPSKCARRRSRALGWMPAMKMCIASRTIYTIDNMHLCVWVNIV